MNNAEVLAQDWVQEMLAKPLLARLGTCNPRTSQPHVTPVWFLWDGEVMLVSFFSTTRKGREMKANPRVSLLVDTGNPGERTQAVLFEGTAEIIADPELVRPLAEKIYLHYAGPDGLDADMKAWLADPDNRILRLAPEKVYSWGW